MRQPGRAERYAPTPWARQRLYRPFVRSAIVVALTLGFAPGTLLLVQLALGASWLDWSAWRDVHGTAQVYGWAGLFIFGFASHIVPRFRGNARIAFPRPQRFILALVILGLALSSAPGLLPNNGGRSQLVAMTAASSLFLAGSFFAVVLGGVLRRGESSGIPFERWLWSGLAFLLLSGLLFCLSAATGHIPLREAALVFGLYGFAGNFLFGVSLRATAGFLRLRPRLVLPEQVAFAVTNGGIATMGANIVLELDPELLPMAELTYALGVIIFIAALRVLEPPTAERSSMATACFLLAAYGWLTLTALLLAVMAVSELAGSPLRATALPVTHTFGMGFLTMTIFGFAFRVLPLLEGRALPHMRLVTPTFVLLNTSTGLRLASSPWTTDLAIWTLAVSGVLGLCAMLLFSVNAWPLCSGSKSQQVSIVPPGYK